MASASTVPEPHFNTICKHVTKCEPAFHVGLMHSASSRMDLINSVVSFALQLVRVESIVFGAVSVDSKRKQNQNDTSDDDSDNESDNEDEGQESDNS